MPPWRAALNGVMRKRRLVGAVAAYDGDALARSLARNLDASTARALAVRILSKDTHQIDFTRDGLRWTVDLGDDIGRSLYVTGGYETDAIAAILRLLPPAGIVIDLGANVGTTTIPFALAGYRVIAVEPVPETFEMLTTNVIRNGLADRITCLRQAIAPERGVVKMRRGAGSGQATVEASDRPPAEGLIEVPAVPLSEIATTATLVWADVQGSETAVIDSGVALWESGAALFLEIDPEMLEAHHGVAALRSSVVRHFERFASRADLIAGRAPRPIDEFDDFVATISSGSYTDALLLPSAPGLGDQWPSCLERNANPQDRANPPTRE